MSKVGIIGLGFVGSGMSRLFSSAHEVYTYDKYNTTHNATMESILRCDFIFVCVPTPMAMDGSCDTSAVDEVVMRLRQVGGVVVIKSTVPPGTCDRLENAYYGTLLHFSPEYMGEGKQFVAPWKYPDPRDAKSHPFVICGGKRAGEVLDLYSTVMANDAAYLACSNVEAELAKYMENSFLAMKVAFCYEFAGICDAYNADYKKVRELWLNDPRMGRSHTMVLSKQKGFDGKCLPKDISAIVESASANGYDAELLRAVRDINAKRMGMKS